MTPQQWSSAATKLARANPGLNRAEIITRMNLQGMPRPTGVESKGTDSKGRPRFGPKTRSQGQTERRKDHEKTSTSEAADQLAQLKEMQQTMNNMAAHARSIGLDVENTNLEHAYPSDQADVIGDRGRPGDYTYLNPDNEASWKTAFEQYNRTYGGSRYRLIPREQGYRVVDTAYADHLGSDNLPGMDVDESMSTEQIFNALPIMIRQDLSIRQTQFPGQGPLPGLTTTAGQVRWKPPALPGFDTSVQPGPSVTAPQGGGYTAPQVMETNGENGTNGDNGHSHSNGGPPKNGSNGKDTYVTPQVMETNGGPTVDLDTVRNVVVGTAVAAGALVVEAGKVFFNPLASP